MSYLEGDYPEFLPRFEKAFIEAHKDFVESFKTINLLKSHRTMCSKLKLWSKPRTSQR